MDRCSVCSRSPKRSRFSKAWARRTTTTACPVEGRALKALLLVAASVTLLGSGYAGIDESFSLAVGETASVAGTDLSLRFVAVTRDSRCPKDVSCIVAGEAVVVLGARVGAEDSELMFKVPPGGKDEQAFGRFTIAIVELEPETDSTKNIDAFDYVATVVVTGDYF